MKNSPSCVVLPFRANSGTSKEEAPLVFPDLCGREFEVTPTVKQTMAIVFSGFGIDVDLIKTLSQLFQAGQYTISNPPMFTPSIAFVSNEIGRLNALTRLLGEVQHSYIKDRTGMPARMRTQAFRDIADGKPISPERYKLLMKLSRFDVITGTGHQMPANDDNQRPQDLEHP
jgi:hypothetical protein